MSFTAPVVSGSPDATSAFSGLLIVNVDVVGSVQAWRMTPDAYSTLTVREPLDAVAVSAPPPGTFSDHRVRRSTTSAAEPVQVERHAFDHAGATWLPDWLLYLDSGRIISVAPELGDAVTAPA